MKSRFKLAFAATFVVGATVVGAIVGATPAQATPMCGQLAPCLTTACVNNLQCYSSSGDASAAVTGTDGKYAGSGTCAYSYSGPGCQFKLGPCGGTAWSGSC
jgi:hypothetical protein